MDFSTRDFMLMLFNCSKIAGCLDVCLIDWKLRKVKKEVKKGSYFSYHFQNKWENYIAFLARLS